jgi:hypothetical protein
MLANPFRQVQKSGSGDSRQTATCRARDLTKGLLFGRCKLRMITFIPLLFLGNLWNSMRVFIPEEFDNEKEPK